MRYCLPVIKVKHIFNRITATELTKIFIKLLTIKLNDRNWDFTDLKFNSVESVRRVSSIPTHTYSKVFLDCPFFPLPLGFMTKKGATNKHEK